MKFPWSKKEETGTIISCPRCNAPVPSKNPFCEACGARIAPPPSCSLCGTLLEPGSRFCPSCGTLIGSSKERPAKPAAERHQKKQPEPSQNNAAKLPETPASPEHETGSGPFANTPQKGEEFRENPPAKGQHKVPVKKAVPSASRATTPPPGPTRGLMSGPGLNKTAVILVLILFIAGIALVFTGILTLPRISSPDTVPVQESPETTMNTPAATDTIPMAEVTETTTGNTILIPGPTQTIPAHLEIVLVEERDPRTKMVSVQFMGGKGQNGVREIFTRLTRSDGEVLTGSFKPLQFGSGIELQGTEQTDRLEVIVRYYSGEEYTVVDRIFEYKVRSA